MDLIVNKKPVMNARSLVKLDPQKQLDAMDVAAKNGADDVFIRSGKDMFVASGQGLAKGVKAGDPAEVGGIKGKIAAIDREKSGGSHAPLVAGAIGAGIGSAVLYHAVWEEKGKMTGAIAGGVMGGIIAGVATSKTLGFPEGPDYHALESLKSKDTSLPAPMENGASDELTAAVVAGITQMVLQQSQVKDLDKQLAADYKGTIQKHVKNETAQKALLALGDKVGDKVASNLIAAGIGSLSGTVVELMKDDDFRALYASNPMAFASEVAKRGGKNFVVALGAAFVTGQLTGKK